MELRVIDTGIGGVKLVEMRRFHDDRGFFCETYSRKHFSAAGIDTDFCQDNHSLSYNKGTVRGLHFQLHPHAQVKLVRVVRGRILDVAVDIRRTSPSYGRHIAVELDARDARQLYIPAGLAHGFCTLEPNTEVVYKVDRYYDPDHDRSLYWADPSLAIAWPVTAAEAVISSKDASAPLLEDYKDILV